MARKQRTPDETIEQSGHVLSEIQMLGALRVHFLNGDHDRAVKMLSLDGLASRNALVESASAPLAVVTISPSPHHQGGAATQMLGPENPE